MTLPPYLTERDIADLVKRALAEDVGSGDVTTAATVASDQQATATIRAKAPGVVAGLVVAEHVFAAVDASIQCVWEMGDGAVVEPGQSVGTLQGPACGLLTGERLALNLMQRMSGIATATRRMVDAAKPHGAEILDTRKTAPGLRHLDKWAVALGGGTNHRVGLYDLILIKDNHIAAAGGVEAALDAAQAYLDASDRDDLQIEIETQTLEEVDAVVQHRGADILLLDNMAHGSGSTVDVSMLEEAVRIVGDACRTEASGNVTLDTVPAIAATGVDAISSGALTHSVTALDLSMSMSLR